MFGYYHAIARWPVTLVAAIGVVCLICNIGAIWQHDWPDFSDPALGFETRGTTLGKRIAAWQNMKRESYSEGLLVVNPSELVAYEDTQEAKNTKPKHAHKRNKKKNRRKHGHKHGHKHHNKNWHDYEDGEREKRAINWSGELGVVHNYEVAENDSRHADAGSQQQAPAAIEYGEHVMTVDEDEQRQKIASEQSTWERVKKVAVARTWSASANDYNRPYDGYFCDSPHKSFTHFVVERIGPSKSDSLFDLNGLLAMCELQQQIASVHDYSEYCVKELSSENDCRPWSLPNYAAFMANKSSCFELQQEDVIHMRDLLLKCYPFYHKLQLERDCRGRAQCEVPDDCKRHNLVFEIMYYLTDVGFIKTNNTHLHLKYAMIYMPIGYSPSILPLYYRWQQAGLKNELVEVIAMDLGLENELFNELLITDVWLVSFGGVFVMLCIWLYTRSFFITVMACIAVAFSLGLSYFFYVSVFGMKFFPYMNLLAIVVIIGVGADDVFLFMKIWECVKLESLAKSSLAAPSLNCKDPDILKHIMAQAMRHAAASMLVTSLTTGGAFYVSYISSITAIKCFGIFAGTVVMTNYLFMITWLPAAVSIMERYIRRSPESGQLSLRFGSKINDLYAFIERLIIGVIMKYALLWIIIFGAIGLVSAVIVFYWPGLQLPQSVHFQLFEAQHPFEVYSGKIKDEFQFERTLSSYENYQMPLRFVWGIEAIDDGDYTNPDERGTLHFQQNFNISSKAAQIWMYDFCAKVRRQPFYRASPGIILPDCYIENLIKFMERRCLDDMYASPIDRSPCCQATFPYEPHVFEQCLPASISNLYATPRDYFMPTAAGPKFARPTELELSKRNSNSTPLAVKAAVIEFQSNVPFTTMYEVIKDFYKHVDDWFRKELDSAPAELRSGWFISELKFFDVQDTLSRDTKISIALAMLASLIVLLCVTLNVLVSIYAVITVTLSILTTVAVLILLGWRLNILESVAVSTAIGLAIDFSLHYGIHYRMAPSSERIAATEFALSRIIAPTIMAAMTTGVAGGIMMASNVLPYIQIGVFLTVVMIISWSYATFFLMSLLRLAGPQHGFAQFKLPMYGKHHANNGSKYFEGNRIINSEQLLTPTSSGHVELIIAEQHELDSLDSNALPKRTSNSAADNEHLNCAIASTQLVT